jgi:hypothetical protein
MGEGVAPAIGLVDPKFAHDAGAAVRAASCYGIRQAWFSMADAVGVTRGR